MACERAHADSWNAGRFFARGRRTTDDGRRPRLHNDDEDEDEDEDGDDDANADSRSEFEVLQCRSFAVLNEVSKFENRSSLARGRGTTTTTTLSE